MGHGSARNKTLTDAVKNYPPEVLCQFLVEKQGSLYRDDLNVVSNIAHQLSGLATDGLVDGLGRIQEPWLKEVFYQALIQNLSAKNAPPGIYLETAGKIPAAAARRGFLTTYTAYRMRTDAAAALQELPALRELNPSKTNTGWYNQLVADALARTPADKVDAAWQNLGLIDDHATRILAARHLFGALLDNDSLAATAWLNAIPESSDKQQAISYLVQHLTAAGDHANAVAWKALLRTPE